MRPPSRRARRLEQLEHLCRYVTRPPIATLRLALAPDGRVIYAASNAIGATARRLSTSIRGSSSSGSRHSFRAGFRLARPRRPQARARIHFASLRPARSQLTDRAQHLRPLAFDLSRALPARLRPRRPHLPLTRAVHAASSHSSQTQSSCARSSRIPATRRSLHAPRPPARLSCRPSHRRVGLVASDALPPHRQARLATPETRTTAPRLGLGTTLDGSASGTDPQSTGRPLTAPGRESSAWMS